MKYIKKVITYMRIIKCYGESDMEIGYQEDIDDLVFLLESDYEYDHSVEIDVNFIIDIDKRGKMVAIEIVDCSKQIDESPKYIKEAKKEVFVEVYEFSYKIIISFNDGEKEIVKRVLK